MRKTVMLDKVYPIGSYNEMWEVVEDNGEPDVKLSIARDGQVIDLR